MSDSISDSMSDSMSESMSDRVIHPFIYLSIHLSIYLSIHLSIHSCMWPPNTTKRNPNPLIACFNQPHPLGSAQSPHHGAEDARACRS